MKKSQHGVTILTNEGTPEYYGINMVWPIVDGKVSPTPITSPMAELYVNFGYQFIDETTALITGEGAYSIVNIDETSFEVTHNIKVNVPNSVLLCWTTYSPRFDTIFLSDGGVVNITMVDPTSGAIKGTLIQDPGLYNASDITVIDNYLYVVQGGSISVNDLTGLNRHKYLVLPAKQVQLFDLPGEQGFISGLAKYD